LAVLALASIGYSVSQSFPAGVDELVLFFILAVLAILAEVYATWIPAFNWEISSSIAICIAGLYILGPHLAVLLVFVTSLVSELFLRWSSEGVDRAKGIVPITFNISQLVLTVTAAGALLQLLGHTFLEFRAADDYLLAIGAFGVYVIVNLSFVTGIIKLTEGKKFFLSLWQSVSQFFVQYLVLCVSALLLAVLRTISIWHVFLALFPLTLVHISFRGYVKLQTEARKTFERISRLLDERDHYTAIHSQQVAELAVEIALEMGLPQGEVEKVDIAARVHDIGKVAVPDSILLKPGPLSDEEWAIMRRHPVISAELIEGLEIYGPVVDAVRHEHERWDGSGYPDGLRGDEIPLIARIIAAADIHNALTTDRPYRKAFSEERTIAMLEEMRGTDLDPDVADALLRVIGATRSTEVSVLEEEIPSPAAET
jgi:HD-GYP domain-containing protein (c-di-GMP phosphodiesterase class II)